MATHLRTCPLCEAMCGLEIETDGDRVVRVRGDRDDVWSKGFLCPKGASIGGLHHDPDRLRGPMVREGTEWREATWDEAFRRCEELLHGVVAEHGIGSVHAYLGNPNAHSYSLGRYSGAVVGLGGIQTIWSAGTVDQWPKNLVCAQLYGGAWTIPIPDVANTDLFVVMGANPHASNGSLLSFPDLIGEVDRIRERGGRTIVVDPRRTGTAERADEWMPIVPGGDAALLLAVVHVLGEEGLVDLGDLTGRVRGVDEVLAAALPYSPEAVADGCGVPADRIRALARELAAAERPVVYGRIGLCNQEFGTLASWLVEVVNVLLGRLGAEGGSLFPRPALATISSTARRRGPITTGKWRTRVRGAPEVMGQAPLSCLAEEIDTPGEGQVKALITIAGNPVLSAPDAARLDAALPMLDAMIAVDNYLNETTRHADVILPGLSPLEQPHCDEAIWGFALRAVARWSPAIFDMGERPDEWEVCLILGAILSGMPADSIDVDALDDFWFGVRADRHGVDGSADGGVGRGPDRIVDLTFRTSTYGDRYGERPGGLNLREVQRHPHGLDLGPSQHPVDEVLRTNSGDVELAHDVFLDDLARLQARMAEPRPDLVLIGRRHVRSNNSWMHNLPALMKGRDRSTLLVHPDDAAARDIEDGGKVRVTTEAGSVVAIAELSDELVRGVVSLPHGFGHDLPGTRGSVAAERPGVNTNVLIPGTAVDVPSGNAAVNGVPVEIAPV
ncbi:molybdopterin-dependent oxidoreductase [Dermatobacter hominis]|uniref:molybdopterin-dependent oxidoreductase n=1 Tax=Dermatobacter hominis TaxID=2884263 RepID=UPI001D124253|nr:molybdopterin-dependent oxidoreductase [Dermatobacter hominis]UDY34492.1 molybdopterin-dependent oxidoreductase [Dermatobacter hominis]